jgi:hypothetical protein
MRPLCDQRGTLQLLGCKISTTPKCKDVPHQKGVPALNGIQARHYLCLSGKTIRSSLADFFNKLATIRETAVLAG